MVVVSGKSGHVFYDFKRIEVKEIMVKVDLSLKIKILFFNMN